MKIVSRRSVVSVSYSLVFEYAGSSSGAGFAFDCKEDGTPLESMPEAARANFDACLTGSVDGRKVERKGVRREERRYAEPAVGICEKCRRRVQLDSLWANECECGAEYNGSGQRLAPRSQWGEETGERFC